MKRRRLTEVFPFLLPLRKWQRKIFFYIKMFFDGNTYARHKGKERLEFKVFESKSLMVNKNSGFDISYQINKVDNLKLASQTINKVLIKPGQVFSFWQLVRHANKYGSYKKGLNLVNGKIVGSHGGGLCQLSNELYWVFLHTPLRIIERHSHRVQNFSPNPGQLLGIDATITEGWKDLKVRNEGERTFQIVISFDKEYIYSSIYCDKRLNTLYEVFNGEVSYYREGDRIIQKVLVGRREIDIETMERENHFLYENQSQIAYELDDTIEVFQKEEG